MIMPKLEYIGEVYRPSDDTWLLMNIVDRVKPRGDICVDLGAGSGILGLYMLLNKYCDRVVFIDVLEDAVKSTRVNVFVNNVTHRSLVILTDTISLRENSVDVVVANPPYLPAHDPTAIDVTTEGGIEGYETILYFIEYASRVLKTGGEFFLVYSSLSKPDVIESSLKHHMFNVECTIYRYFFYEMLIASRCVKSWSKSE